MTHVLVLVANAGESSISTFRLADGKLHRLAVTGGLTGSSTFVVDPARDLVYAGVKASGDAGLPGIVTLRLDRDSGALTPLSRRDLPGGAMTYVALSHDGTVLLGASYGGGYGETWRIADGVLSEPVSHLDHPNLHAVLPSADGRFAYFVSLGADLVAQYALSGEARLEPLEPATAAAPAGSGPRHLVLNAAGDRAYVLTEFSGRALHYARDTETGTLELRDAADAFDPAVGATHSRLGADPRAENLVWGADLHLADGGRHLWCSERTGSTLGAVAIGPDGAVSAPERFTVTEPQPRGFALSPDGAYLVAAGERSETVSLYAVDGDRLEPIQQAETGRGANWVRFV
ncbi:beta-propeller fold lactonase family protein [Microbacterium sp. 18062]|uniref:lactonase family protein n=1 Tax=Microbacterium sp. 18062 TaxID=2681410 RepID=UPI00135B032D|nr:beta-propeller fold lactonase family protein [Microbacterium sp. 18062]